MSPRPPPKISLKLDHDWTSGNNELGSAVEQQPVGKLVQQSFGEVQHVKFSKPTQPKPKPICDRSGKLEDTEDVFVVKGETSRSHEIDEKGLHEELGSSDRSVKPERLSENIRVKHAHHGTGQRWAKQLKHTHSERTICSWRKSWHCVIQRGRRVQRCNQRGEHWLQHSRTTTFCSETITYFKVIFNNIDNSIHSAKNHETWLKQLETLNCVNYLMLNPKHSAKYVCRTGTSASSTAHAVTSYEMIRQRTRSTSSQFLTSFLFRTSTSGKADHTVTDTGRKKGIKNITLRISSRRNANRENSWAFTIGSSVMHDSERPWSSWVALKKWSAKWTKWRTRTTQTLLQKKNSTYTVAIGGYVRILLVPTRCP